MSNRKNNRQNRRNVASLTGRSSLGSPIETRCQARGLITVDRRKRSSKNKCRRKGRQGNPRNRGY